MNDEAAVPYFRALAWHLPRGTEYACLAANIVVIPEQMLIFSVENLHLLLSRLVINTEDAVFRVICCFQTQGTDI
jgi:hypothetical protein